MSAIPSGVDADLAVCNKYLLPGDVSAASAPTRFSTVLGSCVAVCLFDLERHCGGMNHFLLPGLQGHADGNPARWSTPSLNALVELTLAAGARQRSLQAKVFGGACIAARDVPERLRIGDLNIQAALKFLLESGIEVISHDIGGNTGRKLIFDSHTGSAWVKLLSQKTHLS